jgi:hypothetical protein
MQNREDHATRRRRIGFGDERAQRREVVDRLGRPDEVHFAARLGRGRGSSSALSQEATQSLTA